MGIWKYRSPGLLGLKTEVCFRARVRDTKQHCDTRLELWEAPYTGRQKQKEKNPAIIGKSKSRRSYESQGKREF